MHFKKKIVTLVAIILLAIVLSILYLGIYEVKIEPVEKIVEIQLQTKK